MEQVHRIEGVVVVIGPGVWGKGKTLTEALKQAHRPKRYVAYFAPEDTAVDELGSLIYPSGDFYPVVIERKGV